MTVRTVFREDPRYWFTIGVGVVFVAASTVIVVLLVLARQVATDDPKFPPTTWLSGNGDTVEVTP